MLNYESVSRSSGVHVLKRPAEEALEQICESLERLTVGDDRAAGASLPGPAPGAARVEFGSPLEERLARPALGRFSLLWHRLLFGS